MVFSLPSLTPRPQVWQKTIKNTGFFSRTPSLIFNRFAVFELIAHTHTRTYTRQTSQRLAIESTGWHCPIVNTHCTLHTWALSSEFDTRFYRFALGTEQIAISRVKYQRLLPNHLISVEVINIITMTIIITIIIPITMVIADCQCLLLFYHLSYNYHWYTAKIIYF